MIIGWGTMQLVAQATTTPASGRHSLRGADIGEATSLTKGGPVITDTRQGGHNYQRRIDEMLQANLFSELPAGGDYRLTVVHDDHCGFWDGRLCDFEMRDVRNVIA
jgi:hypothetical protein